MLSMSTLQALIPILSHKFIWSEISEFRGKTKKALVQLGTVPQGRKVLLQPQGTFGKSAICHDRSEERRTYRCHTEN